MIAIPSIELREGACVPQDRGPADTARIRIEDPVAVARGWLELGFQCLHLLDLDAAQGRGANLRALETILALRPGCFQVGGGIRSGGAITRLLNAGAARVIVGTRAIEEPAWLTATAYAFPGVILVATDVRERHVVTRGWTRSVERDVRDILHRLHRLPLAGVLVTAVHRAERTEGVGGVDLDLVRDVVAHCELPVQVAGGLGSIEDLGALESVGAGAAVLGTALYAGAMDARAVAARYAPAIRPPGGPTA
jgi:phosphoribosylformimino-5-aminoimidazole carboxamide ribotide isomerase